MIAVSALRNKIINKPSNAEFYRLRKGFKALNVNHKKGVLKTAQGLLKIQRAYKAMVTDNIQYVSL